MMNNLELIAFFGDYIADCKTEDKLSKRIHFIAEMLNIAVQTHCKDEGMEIDLLHVEVTE